MAPTFNKAIEFGVNKHPKNVDRHIQYGTAGFRYKAVEMEFIVYRMGLLATIRACSKKAAIGLMITASHNAECDNGVKLIDPQGDMLEITWEKYATDLVNVTDAEIDQCIQSIMRECGLDRLETSPQSPVLIAMDTRKSSPSLAEAAMDGTRALDGHSIHYGELTTPQLHYLVHYWNTHQQSQGSEDDYYQKLAIPFKQLRTNQKKAKSNYTSDILVDCANGVGADKLRLLCNKYITDGIQCQIVNDATLGGVLNEQCGADYVKVQQKVPSVQSGDVSPVPGQKCASYDGDADRIVYFYTSKDGDFHLLDGDKIATLTASYLHGLVKESGLEVNIGLVQTAYANGSSTHYIKENLCMPVSCAKTGVKYLHHEAKNYDIGVYFEANGHGTVLFSDDAMLKIQKAPNNSRLSAEQKLAAETLLSSMDLINQTVGDAISDMLLVETILYSYGWSAEDWGRMYTDLPNRQLKVQVADRTVIETTDAERRTTCPPGLQSSIDDLVAQFARGRAFTRPSGTEDVVRVYAEADSQENADRLAYLVAGLVHDLAGGVGERPQPTK